MPAIEVSEHPGVGPNEEAVPLLPYAVLLSVIPLLWTILYVCGAMPIKKGELGDSDCYMRLLRVEILHEGGPWYDPVIPRANAPYGQTSHSTRLFDILLLLGAAPISLVRDFTSALFLWGVVISPLLMFATLMVLQWSTRPILGREGSLSVGFIFVLQLTLFACFQPGRPDHQSFLIFLFALSIGFTLRMILKPFNARLCYMAGVVGALSMWESLESMVPVGITLGVLGLLWVIEDRDFLDKSLHYMLALFLGTGLSLILERAWPTLLTVEFDRLSIVHFSIFGFITLLWIAILMLNCRTQLFRSRVGRFFSVQAGLAILALAVFALFPRFYRGPLGDMDPRLWDLWQNRISEMQPLISNSTSLAILIQLVGSIIVCIPFLIYLLFSGTQSKQRRGWIYMFLVVFLFSSAAIFQYVRWSYYAQAAAVIPMAGLMNITLAWRQNPKSKLLRLIRSVLIRLVFMFGLLILGLTAEIHLRGNDKPRHKLPMIALCEYLNEADAWRERQFRILAHIDIGAEILYRTQHEVIGTPVTIRGRGILDTFFIMSAGTDGEALKLLRERAIDLILLCPKYTGSIYSKPEQTSTFSQRLRENVIPNWLRKVELPSDLSSSFLLFEILEE